MRHGVGIAVAASVLLGWLYSPADWRREHRNVTYLISGLTCFCQRGVSACRDECRRRKPRVMVFASAILICAHAITASGTEDAMTPLDGMTRHNEAEMQQRRLRGHCQRHRRQSSVWRRNILSDEPLASLSASMRVMASAFYIRHLISKMNTLHTKMG